MWKDLVIFKINTCDSIAKSFLLSSPFSGWVLHLSVVLYGGHSFPWGLSSASGIATCFLSLSQWIIDLSCLTECCDLLAVTTDPRGEWTLGVGDGQRGLVCCDSWGCKESDTTEWLNWTELRWWTGCTPEKKKLGLTGHLLLDGHSMWPWWPSKSISFCFISAFPISHKFLLINSSLEWYRYGNCEKHGSQL